MDKKAKNVGRHWQKINKTGKRLLRNGHAKALKTRDVLFWITIIKSLISSTQHFFKMLTLQARKVVVIFVASENSLAHLLIALKWHNGIKKLFHFIRIIIKRECENVQFVTKWINHKNLSLNVKNGVGNTKQPQ